MRQIGKANSNLVFNLLLLALVVAIDQASKWSILAFLPKNEIVDICPFLNLVFVLNFGVSFGLLSAETMLEHCVLLALIIMCLSLLIYLFTKLKTMVEQTLCAVLIGGASSNLLDRFFHGGVVDFLDFHYAHLHWPAFNIADALISCSAVGLVAFNLFGNKTSHKDT